MNRRNLSVAAMTLAALMMSFSSGCAKKADSNAMAEDESKCAEVKPGTITTVNTVCVVNPNDPVDPSMASAEWKGQKIGFCCPGCTGKWAKWSPAQKDAAVAKALAMSKK